MDMIFKIFFIVIIVVAIVLWFSFIFGMLFSPKLRSKFMGHQLKMQKQMLEDNKDVIQDLGTLSGGIGVKTTKGILDENEADLKDIATKGANISKDAISTTARAIKEGLVDENVYCKYCGASIDSDSNFCKKCGKEQ